MSIRFGNILEFKCFIGHEKEEKIKVGVRSHKLERICLKCYKRFHNTILIPCNHAVYCHRCIKTYSEDA